MKNDKKDLAEKIASQISRSSLGSKVLSDIDFLEECQNLGFNITESNFYSSIPIVSECSEIEIGLFSAPRYLDAGIFRKDNFENFLGEISVFAPEFKKLKSLHGMPIRKFAKNTMFSHSDAIAYYCVIRSKSPKNIVEIGSGFSTLIANCAREKNNNRSQLYCFEPYPSEVLLAQKGINLTKKKAQDIEADELNSLLCDGDILFIDSTHTVKEGSDVLHLLLTLIPKLKSRVYIHFHDIFLPYTFPQSFLKLGYFWEEQYILYSYLLDNPKITALYGSTYNSQFLKEAMKGFSVTEMVGGSSFWFDYNPDVKQLS